MPKYIFDFNLSCWIQRLEIEADSEEEAQEKLRKMPALDLVDYGYVHSSDISDVDVEVEEEDEDDYDDDEEYYDDEEEEEDE